MLVWQPSQLKSLAASDGFIWADAESAFSSEMRGYVCSGNQWRDVCTDDLQSDSGDVCSQKWLSPKFRISRNPLSASISIDAVPKSRS